MGAAQPPGRRAQLKGAALRLAEGEAGALLLARGDASAVREGWSLGEGEAEAEEGAEAEGGAETEGEEEAEAVEEQVGGVARPASRQEEAHSQRVGAPAPAGQ